ncbi:MAG: putative hemolysin [Acidimicrobiales bacterium]|jgi:choice-of-anchor C domain-containing protein|nr:putative hemolysin [Acidimicrobiales bacterium]
MFTWKRSLTALVGLAALASPLATVSARATAPGPFTNGGFESPPIAPTYQNYPAGDSGITGWTVTLGGVDLVTAPYPVFEGSQALDLNGDGPDGGAISQTFSTVAGKTYHLSYEVNTNNGNGTSLHGKWQSGTEVSEGDYTYTASGAWVKLEGDFLAQASSATLTLTSTSSGSGGVIIDDVKVVINNNAPVASVQNLNTNEDTALVVNLSSSTTDADSDPLTYTITVLPTNGTLKDGTTVISAVPATLSGSNVTYTPNANYNGSDSFKYTANDGVVDSNEATINVTVASVTDTTTLAYNGASSGYFSNKGARVSFSGLITSSDPACVAGRSVTFTANNANDTNAPYTFGPVLTNSSGNAAVSVTTSGWITSSPYTINITTPAKDSGITHCTAGADSHSFQLLVSKPKGH